MLRIGLLGALLAGCGGERVAQAQREANEAVVSCDEATVAAWRDEAGAAALTLAGEDCHGEFTTGKLGLLVRASATRVLELGTYRGKRVRVRGEVWTRHGAFALRAAMLALRATGPTPRMSEVDLRDGEEKRWREVELCIDVPADAEGLELAISQTGRAETRVRWMSAKVVGDAAEINADSTALQRVEQVMVFARMYAHLRYFYPAAASERAWAMLAEEGIAVAEAAGDRVALVRGLTAWAAKVGAEIEVVEGPIAAVMNDRDGPGWRHRGVAGARSLYGSEFVGSFATAPDRVVAEVGLGRFLRFPRAFGGQMRPRALVAGPVIDACAELDRPRSRRLATVVMMWGLLANFFPYHEVVKSDWDGELRIALEAAAVASGPRDLLRVLRRMLVPLRDSHIRLWYGPESTCKLPLEWRWIDEQLVITRRPEEGVLRVGDGVERIDGIAVGERIAEVEAEVSAATPAARRDLTVRRLRDEPKEASTVLVVRGADGERRVELACGGRLAPEDRGEALQVLADGVMVLRLADFKKRGSLGAELLKRMAQAPGLIVDLRRSADAAEVLPHLLDRPIEGLTYASLITAFPGASGRWLDEAQQTSIAPEAPRFTAPVAFVVDERAVSSAESSLAYVHEHRLAAIFGATTAGSTCDVNQRWLPDGFELRWTGCVAQWRNGAPFHGVGVPPTHPLTPTQAGVAAGRDELLDAALAWVREQAALRP